MNAFYDHDEARGILNSYLAKCYQDGGNATFLPLLSAADIEVDHFTNPDCWRLTKTGTDDPDEVQVRIPGVMCRSMLPPMVRKLSPKDKPTIRNLRQFVKITGLGALVYGEIEKKMREIEGIFHEAVGGRSITPMTFHEYEGEYAIDAHCRYFTDRRVAPMMRHEGFQMGVDPDHRLEVARGEDFVHGIENVVQYLQLHTDGDGKERYEEVLPTAFKNGDIVDVRLAFICYPLFDGGCKIVPTLRSLILLSNVAREGAARRMEEVQVRKRGGSSQPLPNNAYRGIGKGKTLKRKLIDTDCEGRNMGRDHELK